MLRKLAIVFAAVSVGLLILVKVFIYPDCFSFDAHDEANHAFPGLHVAQQAIRAGQLPTINFYNNFGAPLLGDALTYPFALQSLTYYFLDGHLAMTVNRFVIAIATVITAFGFFRIYLASFPALVCAVLIYFNPVAFWYPVHQYQMAAPFFFGSFFLLNKFILHRSVPYFAALFVLFCALILSVSINHVVLMVPFLLTWTFCRNGFRIDRIFLAPIVALAGAVVLSYPQTLEFVQSFVASARADEGVYDSILTNMRELFLGLVVPPGEWIAYNYGAQLQVTSYLSMPVILAIATGVWLIRRKIAWKQTSLLFCGIVPTLLAIMLYMSPALRFSIPLVKSMDISRVWWFSIPFCYVYVGYFIVYARLGRMPPYLAALLLLAASVTLVTIHLLPETAEVSPLHSICLLLAILGAGAMLIRRGAAAPIDSRTKAIAGVGGALLIGSLVLTPVPVMARVLGLNSGTCAGTQYSTNFAASRFAPYSLIDLMEKGHRLATEIHTHKGHDLRVASEGILGSDARGIVVDGRFGKYLEDKRLVTVDQVPYGYYFSRPWQTDELTRLGIRYLLVGGSSDAELEGKKWRRLGTADGLSLYENPVKPTPVYLVKSDSSAPRFIREYRFVPNQANIQLPVIASAATLVLTIVHRPGFEAQIDGRTAAIATRNGMISLDVRPGDSVVKIRHHPYAWYHVIIGAVVAILMAVLFGWWLSSRRVAGKKG